MIPFRSGYYYFDINDVAIYDKYVILNVLFKNSVTKYEKTLEDGVSLGKNMNKFIKNGFGRFSSTVEEEVLVYILGVLKGIELTKKSNKYYKIL